MGNDVIYVDELTAFLKACFFLPTAFLINTNCNEVCFSLFWMPFLFTQRNIPALIHELPLIVNSGRATRQTL